MRSDKYLLCHWSVVKISASCVCDDRLRLVFFFMALNKVSRPVITPFIKFVVPSKFQSDDAIQR